MTRLTGFRITQGFYWLGLGTWIGAMVMLAVAAAITFGTVRGYEPTIGIEPYNDPAFAEHQIGILAGGIVGNVLGGLKVVQIVCAAVVVLGLVLQMTAFARWLAGGRTGAANLLRVALIAGPILILAADHFYITPRVWEHRAVMYGADETDEAREAARAEFGKYHKLNETVVGAAVFMLIGAVFASAFTLHGPRPEDAPTS